MSNELIRELVTELSIASDFLPMNGPLYSGAQDLIVKARAYLETGGWTKVEDGLPVVLKPEWRVEVWLWRQETKLPTKVAFDQTMCTPDGFPSRFTHWRYAEPTPEPPKG